MTLDSSSYDITKELKKKMRVLDRGSFGGMSQRPASFVGQRSGMMMDRSAMQSMTARRTMNQGMAGSFSSRQQSAMQEVDEREDLCPYLFKTHARNKMLAFKKIAPDECPLRMLPLDYLETLEEDGYEMIVSTTTTVSEESKSTAENSSGQKKSSRRLGRKKTKKGEADSQPLSKSIYILCFVSLA